MHDSADEILVLSLSSPGAIPKRVLTCWCFARGANGTKAFRLLCRYRRFYLAKWLVDHGAIPAPWQDDCWYTTHACSNRRKFLREQLLRQIGYVKVHAFGYVRYCPAAETEMYRGVACVAKHPMVFW